MRKHFSSINLISSVGIVLFITGCISGLVGENRRYVENPENINKNLKLKKAIANGDELALIELTNICLSHYYPEYDCSHGTAPRAVEYSRDIFKKYSTKYKIAKYYNALSLVDIFHNEDWVFHNGVYFVKREGLTLLTELAVEGCEYEVKVFDGNEQIKPCKILKDIEREKREVR